MGRPSVLLADDHAMVAEGLAQLLQGDFDLVATVGDGWELVSAARRLRPDVVVSDVGMPRLNGLDAMRQLKAERRLETKFIFLTVYADPAIAVEAMRAGAAGYLLKQAAGDELIQAVHDVLRGRTYLTPLITREVVARLAHPEVADSPGLTLRQREVLQLIAAGLRMKEIAHNLNLSVRTVETHKYGMMRALDIDNTADLIRFAIKHGLVSR